MIVRADRELCIGAGTCVNTVPEVFELDEEGRVRVIAAGIDPAQRDDIQDAVDMCPVEALSVED